MITIYKDSPIKGQGNYFCKDIGFIPEIKFTNNNTRLDYVIARYDDSICAYKVVSSGRLIGNDMKYRLNLSNYISFKEPSLSDAHLLDDDTSDSIVINNKICSKLFVAIKASDNTDTGYNNSVLNKYAAKLAIQSNGEIIFKESIDSFDNPMDFGTDTVELMKLHFWNLTSDYKENQFIQKDVIPGTYVPITVVNTHFEPIGINLYEGDSIAPALGNTSDNSTSIEPETLGGVNFPFVRKTVTGPILGVYTNTCTVSPNKSYVGSIYVRAFGPWDVDAMNINIKAVDGTTGLGKNDYQIINLKNYASGVKWYRIMTKPFTPTSNSVYFIIECGTPNVVIDFRQFMIEEYTSDENISYGWKPSKLDLLSSPNVALINQILPFGEDSELTNMYKVKGGNSYNQINSNGSIQTVYINKYAFNLNQGYVIEFDYLKLNGGTIKFNNRVVNIRPNTIHYFHIDDFAYSGAAPTTFGFVFSAEVEFTNFRIHKTNELEILNDKTTSITGAKPINLVANGLNYLTNATGYCSAKYRLSKDVNLNAVYSFGTKIFAEGQSIGYGYGYSYPAGNYNTYIPVTYPGTAMYYYYNSLTYSDASKTNISWYNNNQYCTLKEMFLGSALTYFFPAREDGSAIVMYKNTTPIKHYTNFTTSNSSTFFCYVPEDTTTVYYRTPNFTNDVVVKDSCNTKLWYFNSDRGLESMLTTATVQKIENTKKEYITVSNKKVNIRNTKTEQLIVNTGLVQDENVIYDFVNSSNVYTYKDLELPFIKPNLILENKYGYNKSLTTFKLSKAIVPTEVDPNTHYVIVVKFKENSLGNVADLVFYNGAKNNMNEISASINVTQLDSGAVKIPLVNIPRPVLGTNKSLTVEYYGNEKIEYIGLYEVKSFTDKVPEDKNLSITNSDYTNTINQLDNYIIETDTFNGYNGKRLSQRNLELTLSRNTKIVTKIEPSNNFFD